MKDRKELPPWRSEVVVGSYDVERYNLLGYQVAEIHDEEIASPLILNDQVIPSGQAYPVHVSRQESVVTKVLKFLMVKDGESRIAELTSEVEGHKSETMVMKTKLQDAEKVAAGYRSSSEQLKIDIERRRVELEKQNMETAELRRRMQKMEGDISKIRTAIGDLKMKEIIGA